MKLEDIKKEMEDLLCVCKTNNGKEESEMNRIIKRWIENLPDADAKLRKVREEVEYNYKLAREKLTCCHSQEALRKFNSSVNTIISRNLSPTEPEVDEELEAAKKAWPVGRKFKWTWSDTEHIYDIAKIDRDYDNEIVFWNKKGTRLTTYSEILRNPKEYSLLPLEPKWPDIIRDGWYLYWNINKYYLTDIKPSKIDGEKGFLSVPERCGINLEDFLAPLGLTIKDLAIPDVPVSERIWCKGGAK